VSLFQGEKCVEPHIQMIFTAVPLVPRRKPHLLLQKSQIKASALEI